MFRLDFDRVTAGDMDQNVALKSEDVIYVPRSFMGDVNDAIAKIDPLLSILLLPATYRDLYTTGGGLRIDTGETEGTGSVFTRTLPGTAGKATTGAEKEKPSAEDSEPPADEDEGNGGDRE